MSDTSFTSFVTKIVPAWLNKVNDLVWKGRSPIHVTSTGTANAQVITLPATSLYSTLTSGDKFTYKAHAANTGAMTLQVVGASTLDAKDVYMGGAALSAGQIQIGDIVEVTYDGTRFQITGGTALTRFVQSGNGAIAETTQDALRRLVHTAQYSTQGNFETARDALTGTFGMANLDVRGQAAITGSSASLVIDNESDTDFLDAIVLKAGSSAIQKRYLDFRNLNDTTEWRMGANATAGFIIFNNADERHPFWAAAASIGGNTLISAGTGGTVKINAEADVCANTGLAVHAGGSGTPARWVTLDGNGVRIFVGGLQFGAAGGSADVGLFRESANVIGQRFGTSPQSFWLYATATDGSNYERLALVNNAGASTDIFTAHAGTGSARTLRLGAGNTMRWQISGSSGHLTAVADNTYDIGNSGALRPRTVYAGTNIIASGASGSAIGAATSSSTALNLPAGTTGVSSIRIAHGAAPTSPVDGDIWTTTAGLFVRINGATVGPLAA